MNVRFNFGIFKVCSLKIPFNNHGVCHFDFFKFNNDLIFLFSEMLKVQRKEQYIVRVCDLIFYM
jgi:hypothetical protein